MTKASKWLAVASLVAAGCSGSKGDTGAQGTPGAPGTPGTPTLTAESCVVCHAPGTIGDQLAMHATASSGVLNRYSASISGVSIPNAGGAGGRPTITYTVRDASGRPVSGLIYPVFTISKLVAGQWQSYINKLDGTVKVADIEGTRNASPPGTLVENPAGTYTYTFVDDLSQPKAVSSKSAITETYEPAATTRFGLQNDIEPQPGQLAFNATFDLVPAGGTPAADPHATVTMAACNKCHQQLAVHGNKRLDVPYCVMCHNPGTGDPVNVGGPTLELAVLVHGIHMGRNLPSLANAANTYQPNGNDFSGVAFPQDPGNCGACHDASATTAPANNWLTHPSIAYCGACHNRTYFTASTPDPTDTTWAKHYTGAVADGTCGNCHTSDRILAQHNIGLAPVPYVFKVISVTNTSPGSMPVINYAVTKGGENVDLTTDPGWSNNNVSETQILAFSTVDYTNAGLPVAAGSAYGAPVLIDADIVDAGSGVTRNPDGTYTVTSPVALPSTATGSGIAVMEGHPGLNGAEQPGPDNAYLYFAITDATPTARRQVVDIAKCDNCHLRLSVHGNNRTNLVETCVTCHNSEATDILSRTTPPFVDGQAEGTIDFPYMIHRIHNAGATGPYTVYHRGNASTFGPPASAALPANWFPGAISNCYVCHADSWDGSDGGMNGITTSTAGDPTSSAGFLRTTQMTAVCGSCHTSAPASDHFQQNGGHYGLTQAQITALK